MITVSLLVSSQTEILKFEENFDRPISECMTSENLITAPVGITLDEAKKISCKGKKREASYC